MTSLRDMQQRKPEKVIMRPFRVVVITMGSIFLAEVVSKAVRSSIPAISFEAETVVDSLAAVIISLPLLHFFVFQPFRRYMADKQLAEAALRESELKYRSLVESTDDSIYLVDPDYRYLFINRRHLSRLGLSEEQVLGRPFSEFHSIDETNEFIKKTDAALSSGESNQYEYQSLRDGKYFLQTFSPVKDQHGKAFALTVVSKNITKRKQMEEELRSLSLTDELTGLYNRRGFMALAAQHLKIANRHGKGIFMLYADMDSLKEINDTFGHKEGDNALFEFSQILKESFRESDIIARIGGDEFVVLPVGSSESSVEIIKTRLENRVDAHNTKRNRGYKISVSVGVPFYNPERPLSLGELIAQGDALMYEQKRFKKNRG